MRPTHLGVFAKYWQPGSVKTRLAKSIGDKEATALYRCFVETTLRRFCHVGDSRQLLFSPPERSDAFAKLVGPEWQLAAQLVGDLGQRMEHYFSETLESSSAAILIGTDSPTLPRPFVEDAFAALRGGAPVVLGPATDGGYYLVGLSQPIPQIFADVRWGTAEVFGQTTARLTQLRIGYEVLPEWYDVDDQQDLERLATELEQDRNGDELVPLRQAVAQLEGRLRS